MSKTAVRLLALALLIALCAAEESDGDYDDDDHHRGSGGAHHGGKGKFGKEGKGMRDMVCAEDFERLCSEVVVGDGGLGWDQDAGMECMREKLNDLTQECAEHVSAQAALLDAFHSSCDAPLEALGCDPADSEEYKECLESNVASLPQACLASLSSMLLAGQSAPPLATPISRFEELEEKMGEARSKVDGAMVRAGGLGALVGASFVVIVALVSRAVLRCRRGAPPTQVPVVEALPAGSPQGSLVFQKSNEQGVWERPASPGSKVSPA